MKRVPAEVWAACAGVLLFCAVWWGVASYGASRYEQGRRDVRIESQIDTALAGVVRRTQAARSARVDTIRERVVIERRRVDTLVVRVPDSLRVVPEVAALLEGVGRLTVEVDSLSRAIDTERAAWVMRATVDSAAIVYARITITEQARTIAKLERRPTMTTVVRGSALAFVLGLIAGITR